MNVKEAIVKADRRIVEVMNRYSVLLMRIGMAIVFIWFGALKPFGVSPANELVASTITTMTWGVIAPSVFIPVLGWWEVAIGVCFLYRPLVRVALILLVIQLPGTMLPLVLLPEEAFTQIPYGLTLEGQYIIKNLVLIAGALVVGGSLREEPKGRYL